jgi:hypothetical protein
MNTIFIEITLKKLPKLPFDQFVLFNTNLLSPHMSRSKVRLKTPSGFNIRAMSETIMSRCNMFQHTDTINSLDFLVVEWEIYSIHVPEAYFPFLRPDDFANVLNGIP